MAVVSLAPKFIPKYHRVYLDLLERALQHRDTHSVALTGSFGSGKSSVLRALPRWYWSRQLPWLRRRVVVELSLATLDPELAPMVQSTNPAEKEMSNRIQKELVKQMLYRLPPRKTPRSRFPRASRPSWRAWLFVTVAGAATVGLAWVVVMMAGWQGAMNQRLDAAGWPAIWFWGFATAASAFLALVSWRMFAGRYALQAGISAGALTLSLQPTSSSYFDQYLDEIMYFFQVSRASVVLIEDVDRFSDAVVFDTLRALNSLVNSSGQVRRRVVFVYAIRDSVLGEIGQSDVSNGLGQVNNDTETALQTLDRSNRAKYFDVIIPIVPFVTAHNAHDLLMTVMSPHVAINEGQAGISPALVRLAARHVADMRTMWSVRNEFEVHLDRLMTSAEPMMPGISEDVVLSLVLLRATSPGAYESIRLGASPLDSLTKRWLELVDANLKSRTDELTALRTELESGMTRATRASKAGEALDSLRSELLSLAPNAQVIQYGGPVADDDLGNVEGWQQIADGTPLRVVLTGRRPGQSPTNTAVTLGRQILARLIGMPIDPSAWHEGDIDQLRRSIADTEKEISFLRYHSWEQLVARPDLTVAATTEELAPDRDEHLAPAQSALAVRPTGASTVTKLTFRQLVTKYAPTPLAAELIENGFLPRHFGRYSSSFYGRIVGVDAAEYLSRAVEVGTPIIEYALDDESISQILAEQGAAGRDDADLFDELSVYNLDIVRHLVNSRPQAAGRVARNLARRWGELERRFVDRFFQRQKPEVSSKLAALMAPTWTQAVRYTTVDSQLPPATRLRLVDAVLGTIGGDQREDLDPEVGRYLTTNYADLPVVTHPADPARASIVMRVIAEAEGTIRELAALDPIALEAATRFSTYPVSRENLIALGGGDGVALDVHRGDGSTPHPIYDHFLANMADYLGALTEMVPAGTPVADPAEFAAVLNDVAASHDVTIVDRFVESASDKCRVADLGEAAREAWPALVSRLRTDPTFENVAHYLSHYGVDEALAAFFKTHQSIDEPPDTATEGERLTVATKILGATRTIPNPTDRVALAASVNPGVISTQSIEGIDGGLVAPMLEAKLFADEAEAFAPTILVDWKDFEAAVAVSEHFAEFADIATMPVSRFVPMLASSLVAEETKTALVGKLPALLEGANPAEASSIARALAERHDIVNREGLDALSEAGANDESLVRLLVGDRRPPMADIVHVLRGMGGDYSRLAAGGSGVVHFEVSAHNRLLLDVLNGITHTGGHEAFAIGRGAHLRANLKRSSLDGD